ncbi:MAG: PorP/SprF family type IX secretion system membrane protein [Flavobacteriales bacterium]|nr:PorP/SprF family type IX secretion system membrane protein [Flavobacteriales bacterium]
MAVCMVLIAAYSCKWSSAQDIHFSQFDVAPMNYNPAMTGQFDGDYRFIGNQRTQWRSVTTPYSTFGLSADARNMNQIAGLGTGVSLYRDRAGDSRYTTTVVNVAGSWLVPVSNDSLHTLSMGAQFGLTHRKIDYSQLQYDNQWNGLQYDPNIDPNEPTTRNSRTHLNLNIGLGYYFKPERRKEFYAGFGLYNLNNPRQSFYDASGVNLDPRFNVHVNAAFPITEKVDVLPSILFQSQGKFKEVIVGSLARYILNDVGGLYRAVYAGIQYRTRDALYLTVGGHYDNWRAGISYDINLSGLRPASNARGGLELSIIYIFKKLRMPEIKDRICPEYI